MSLGSEDSLSKESSSGGSDSKSSEKSCGGNTAAKKVPGADCKMCDAVVGTGASKCSDLQPMSIVKEFRRLYEQKMRQVDDGRGTNASGDCLKAKVRLQEDWIKDLTDQNEMLIRAVTDLEMEATERVRMLEEKLKESAECACEVMSNYKDVFTNIDETFQKVPCLQNDVQNMIEFVRRIRECNEWSVEGLHFYDVKHEDLFGNCERNTENNGSNLQQNQCIESEKTREESEQKDRIIQELRERLSSQEVTCMDNDQEECQQFKKMQDNYTTLKQSMFDMRDALTVEVADKHDMIVSLRRDVQLLEEQCRKADQQTHFKDDIIKELRKDLKQLKHENICEGCEGAKLKMEMLEEENEELKAAIDQAKSELDDLEGKAESFLVGETDEIGEFETFPAVTLYDRSDQRGEIKGCNSGGRSKNKKKQQNITFLFADKNFNSEDSYECNNNEYRENNSQTHPNFSQCGQKSTTTDLEDVINHLSQSVSQMMMRNSNGNDADRKIQELENQLSESLRNKDMDIEEERNRRNREILNLMKTIHEQEDALSKLQNQSTNLQDAVNCHLNSLNVLQESDDKHKLQVAQQKVTISNLQQALLSTKGQLADFQQRGSQEVSPSWASKWFTFATDYSVSNSTNRQTGTSDNVHDV